jgi:hypothetical protein
MFVDSVSDKFFFPRARGDNHDSIAPLQKIILLALLIALSRILPEPHAGCHCETKSRGRGDNASPR